MAAPDFAAVVVAAGSSTRFGADLPKQFQPLGRGTVLQRSVTAIAGHPAVRGVVVVLSAEEAAGARGREIRRWPGVLHVVAGGERRADSVARGLEAAGNAPFVMVHDAARPNVPGSVIDAVIRATRETGAAVPGLTVSDTVKRVDAAGRVVETVDRSVLRLAQTPQGSRTDWLRQALADTASDPEVTDEASALEKAGHPVAVVPGDPGNRKITEPNDLAEARGAVENSPMEIRIGTVSISTGCAPGRPLVLGGVHFEGVDGLDGHSDADVVLHAAMDAVLGAAALGDIGKLFPPEDDRWAGADSKDLTRQVARHIGEAGYEIVNLDLTLLAERPKIRPRADEMRATIAGCFGIDVDRVGLKATTLETLGALGRGEGAACQAAALLRRAG